MKTVSIAVAMVAASMLFTVIPAFAEDGTTGLSNEYGVNRQFDMKAHKDECLIVARNCSGGLDDIMQRVDRLRKEIDKGSDVYTPDELKSLHEQLNWIYSESETFTSHNL